MKRTAQEVFPEDYEEDKQEIKEEEKEIKQETKTETKEKPAKLITKTKSDKTETKETKQKKDKKDTSGTSSQFLTDIEYSTLQLNENLQRAIDDAGYSKMTTIQHRTIPLILNGKDVMAKARTGSGKTLAFLIPIIEILYKIKFQNRNGTGAIILSPTRELAIQIFDVLEILLKYTDRSRGLIIGGSDKKKEEEMLKKGCSIIVATPGRLLDHLINTKEFIYRNLKILVMDEADRIMDCGFEEEMQQILKRLPSKNRQTMLFSATQTEKVENIANISLNNPIVVNVETESTISTSTKLDQGYIIVEAKDRFRLLYTFLRKSKGKKTIVFMSTCNAVKFYCELLNYVDVKVEALHGQLDQKKRTKVFFDFCKAKESILITTDIAARGLDIPAVDMIIQVDLPDNPKDYIHRVGRTARADKAGRALIFIQPWEIRILEYLKGEKIPLTQYEVPEKKIPKIQSELEKLIEKNYYLKVDANTAYKSYINAYASRSMKDVFNINNIDVNGIALSFGLTNPKAVEIKSMKMPKQNKQNNPKRSYPK